MKRAMARKATTAACTVWTTESSPRVAATSVCWMTWKSMGRAPARSWRRRSEASSASRPVITPLSLITARTLGAEMRRPSTKMPRGALVWTRRVVICSKRWAPSALKPKSSAGWPPWMGRATEAGVRERPGGGGGGGVGADGGVGHPAGAADDDGGIGRGEDIRLEEAGRLGGVVGEEDG